jgi:transposase-like protein
MAKRSKREKDALDTIIDQLDLDGVTQDELFGEGGLVKALTSRILNKALEAEMDNHLGYEKHSSLGDRSGNNRNGYSSKKVLTRDQEVELSIPRDRNGEFTPVMVPKHEKRLPIFNEQIIALYSSGMTVRDIRAHLQDIYGVEVSPELISRVTDSILTEVREWRNRPLSPIYPIVYLDALRVNSRESGKNQNKALYIALGINMEGHKEVLGFYLSENEGAKFWMGVLTDLKNRGVDDIFIACMDGLTGFPDAVRAVFPQTRIQLCIVHMIRNSTKFVSYKDLKAICNDLKRIYTASTEEEALLSLEDFGETWNSRYPMIYKSWESHWGDLSEFFSYPEEIRRVIYTTNAIESLNFSLRKVTKNRAAFPTDESIYKIMYLAINKASKKWTMPIRNWGVALNQFSIMFEGRVKL